MSLLGAGIGAGIGALIGGPIGAAIGGWVGHTVSKGEDSEKVANDSASKEHEVNKAEAQTLFFAALFSMLAKMALADGRVSKEEASMINELARNEFNMDAEDRSAASIIFKNALKDHYSIYDYARQYKKIANSTEMCEMVYRLLFSVAYADRELHPIEDDILKNILSVLSLSEDNYTLLKEEYLGKESDLKESYMILACKPSSSDSEVKSAYRKLCMDYHPDKIASKGLPENFMKYAEKQMHIINNAYSTIMEKRRKNKKG